MYIFSEFGQNTINNLPNSIYEVLSGNTYLRFGTVYRHPKTFAEMEIGEAFTGGCEMYRRSDNAAFDVMCGIIAKDAPHWTDNNTTQLNVSWSTLQQNAIPINTPFLFEWQVTRISEAQVRVQIFLEGSLVYTWTPTLSEGHQSQVFNIQHNYTTNSVITSGINSGIRCRNFYHTDTEHRLRNWEFKRLPLISLNDAATSQQLNEQMLGILVDTVLEMKPDTSEIQVADIVGVLTTQQARLRRVSLRTPKGEVHRTFGLKTLPVQELSTLGIESSSTTFYRVEEFISAETEQGMTVEEVDQIHLRTEFKVK